MTDTSTTQTGGQVDQPTNNPTRKLSAATISTAVMAVAGLTVRNMWPEWFDPLVWLAMTPVVSFGIGWFIRDEATMVVVQDVVETSVPVEAAE